MGNKHAKVEKSTHAAATDITLSANYLDYFEMNAYSFTRKDVSVAKDRKWGPRSENGGLHQVKKTSLSNEDLPIPGRTGKANDMSLGDMERQKILTGQGKFIYRQKII